MVAARLFSIGVIFFLALALRGPGLSWGLPNEAHPMLTYHPDEGSMLAVVARMNPLKGDFNPNWFHYPSLHFYTLGAAFGLAHVFAQVPLVGNEQYYLKHPAATAALYRSGRLVSLGYGLATVILLLGWGYLVKRPWVGVLSAGALAVLPVHVLHSSFMTVEAALTFWCTLSLALLSLYIAASQPSRWHYLSIFVTAGVAAAIKYPAALLLAAIWLGLAIKGEFANVFSPIFSRRMWLGYLVFALTFFVLSPYVLLDIRHSLPAVLGLYGSVVNEVQESSRVPFHSMYHLRYSFPVGWGLAMFGAALAGLAWAFYRRRTTDLTLASWIVIYVIMFSYPQEKYLRYLLPVAPAACWLLAEMVHDLWTLAGGGRFKAAFAAGILAVFTITGLKSLAYARLLSQPDARDRAYAWMQQNIPEKSRITLLELPYAYSPPGLYEFEDQGWGLYRKSPRYDLYIIPKIETGTLRLLGDYVVLSEYDMMTALAFPNADPVKRAFLMGLMQHPQLKIVLDEKRRAQVGPWVFDRGYVPEDWLYVNPRQMIFKRLKPAVSTPPPGNPAVPIL